MTTTRAAALESLSLRYDGAIPQAALDALPVETVQGATDAEIAAQIAANVDEATARKRMIASAIVAAAEAGERGVTIRGQWYTAAAHRAKQARAYLADNFAFFSI
jgi:hypothetical protein